MQTMEISQININPNDYERAEKLLGSDLGCWNFFEVFPLRSELVSDGPVKLCVMRGEGLLNRKHEVRPGTVVVAEAGTRLDFSQAQGLQFRYCFPESVRLRQALEALYYQDQNQRGFENPSVTGEWTNVPVPWLSCDVADTVYFCRRPGPLRGQLFSHSGPILSLDLQALLCFTFEGVERTSDLFEQATWVVKLAESIPDLRNEEVLRRKPGWGWCRWTPTSSGSQRLVPPLEGPNKDPLVELLLSHLWKTPSEACRWMRTPPFFTEHYRVPLLHLPEGWTVSPELQERWGIEGVCNARNKGLSVSDICVTIDRKRICWTCNGAREHAGWSYSLDGGELHLRLEEVYD